MMLSLVVLLSSQAKNPAVRLADYLGRSPYFSCEYNITLNQTDDLDVAFRFRWPDHQELIIKSPELASTFRQSPRKILFTDEKFEIYWEYPTFKELIPPSGDFPALARTYPVSLMIFAPGRFKPEIWKQSGPNIATAKLESGANLTIEVDLIGRPIKTTFESHNQTNDVLTSTYTNHKQEWFSVLAGEFELPWGYSPAEVPELKTPLLLGEQSVFGKWTNARNNRSENLERKFKGKSVVVLFTDPDCIPSQKAENALRKVENELKKLKVTLIEVSLGNKEPDLSKKSKSRPIYWDKDGSIEKAWQPNVTPYAFVVKEGEIARGWSGYSDGEEKNLIETLTKEYKN